MRRLLPLAGATGLLLLLAGCAAPPASAPPTRDTPPAGAVADDQLGGAYPPADSVGVVVRDRTSKPADGTYSICYVNAFQTQPGEQGAWPANTLSTREGAPVIDPAWPDEVILDTSTADRRAVIADTVAAWIRGCAASGFRAVEFDNLDTFTRSDGALTLDDNAALARELVDLAHASGLAAGQKNAAEHASEFRKVAGFDFAVAEECAAFDECGAYTEVYGDHVIDIEYTDQIPRSFAEMCADAGTPASTILRDRKLSTPDGAEYAFATCAAPEG
ncbi:endo alpha-1,4 polygalactosaminidase [Microbacterium testaceum]|uniref:endo alpha-1,4 polygalactosaminidase n=1 Tax=Microbacterium testaceum TaxID=2033 RepID=UPI00124536DC|nr:endo alpha-1,4 polygalactosaminidase [Microbacterium testaceum]